MHRPSGDINLLMRQAMRPVIITADDFGYSLEINEAVEQAHRDGVLSAASLMVSGAAAGDAVRRARAMPTLSVGLHVVLVQGTPVLPAAQIPALVAADGRFRDNLAGAGFKWFFTPGARRQLAREIAAQFEAFRASGLDLDHVNGHNHMHLHPTVLGMIIAECRRSGCRSVRLPREPFAFSHAKEFSASSLAALAGRAGLGPWLALMRARLAAAGLCCNDWLLGMHDAGHVDEAKLLDFLDRLPGGVTEIHCHPAVRLSPDVASAMPGYDNVAEFAALTGPAVKERLSQMELQPVGYRRALSPEGR